MDGASCVINPDQKKSEKIQIYLSIVTDEFVGSVNILVESK